jgi:hypothetical protein
MRIKALDLLDSPPPNRDDEIDEISVPFGLAPAEQIVRPERTSSQSRVMRHARDLRSIFRGFVLSESVQTGSKLKGDSAIHEQKNKIFLLSARFRRNQQVERNKHEVADHWNDRRHPQAMLIR